MGSLLYSAINAVANKSLPLKQGDLIEADLIFNIIWVLIVLFGVAYIALRWYAKYLQPKQQTRAQIDGLTIVQTVRISPRSRLLVATLDKQKILIAESASGIEFKFVPKAMLDEAEVNQRVAD